MRLAEDEITIRIDGEAFTLRPSLRAAFRLERQFGGFDQLLTKVTDGDLRALIAVIDTCADRRLERTTLEGFTRGGLVQIEALKAPILDLVTGLAGIDLDNPPKDDAPAKAQDRASFAEHHQRLFRIATGWLGWSPSETWQATPSEIMAAFQGRTELLTAIFGSGEASKAKPDENVTLDDKLRLVIGGIGTRKVTRNAE